MTLFSFRYNNNDDGDDNEYGDKDDVIPNGLGNFNVSYNSDAT